MRKEDDHARQVIKPFFLAQTDSTWVLTHGGRWVDKVRRLRTRGALPRHVLFPVSVPPREVKAFHAFEEIRDGLEAQGVQVVPATQEEQILEFVKRPAH